MTPLHEGGALFITTSVSKSVPFLLTKPLTVRSPTKQSAGRDEVRGHKPSLLLTDSRRIECSRWAGKLKSPLLTRARHVDLLADCFKVPGLRPDVPCTHK